ncbi:MAG: lysophospholipid acyltransferase family protein [Coriobacteriia bacterium]
MGFESFSNSRAGIGTALAVSRALPPSGARWLARLAASRLAANAASPMVRAIRSNQWVASGRTLSSAELDDAAREVLANSGRFLYDLYHLRPGREAIMQRVTADATFERVLTEIDTQPYVYAGCHLGSFDLVGQALGYNGWRAQVLSVPNPNGGYEWQNEIRQDSGLEMTPVSLESLKRAARRLADGGSVVTGLDRPIPNAGAHPRFFGEPAPLPLLHIRLAMRARVPVVVIAGPLHEDGTYRLQASEPIEMTGSDPVANAERVLAVAGEFITARLRQWAMPHAVWPQIQAP